MAAKDVRFDTDARDRMHLLAGERFCRPDVVCILHPDQHLARGGDGVITLWDARTLRKLGELKGHGSEVHALAFLPGGTIDGYLRFGTGLDRLFEALQFGCAIGLGLARLVALCGLAIWSRYKSPPSPPLSASST